MRWYDCCSDNDERTIVLHVRAVRLLKTRSRTRIRLLTWCTFARTDDDIIQDAATIEHPCFVVVDAEDVLPANMAVVDQMRIGVRLEACEHEVALAGRDRDKQMAPPERSSSVPWASGRAPLVRARYLFEMPRRAMTARGVQMPVDMLDDAHDTRNHSSKQRVVVLPTYYRMLDALPVELGDHVRVNRALADDLRATLIESSGAADDCDRVARSLTDIARFYEVLDVHYSKSDTERRNFMNFFRDAFVPAGLAEITTLVRPSALLRSRMRHVNALVRLIDNVPRHRRIAREVRGLDSNVIAALAHALPAVDELPAWPLDAAARRTRPLNMNVSVGDDSDGVLAETRRAAYIGAGHLRAWQQWFRTVAERTRSTVSRLFMPFDRALTQLACESGALIILNEERRLATTGRWAVYEHLIVEMLESDRIVRSLVLLTHAGDSLARTLALTAERLIDVHGAGHDCLYVVSTPAAAVAARDGTAASTSAVRSDVVWVDDVIDSAVDWRTSIRIVCMLDAHRWGARTVYELLQTLARMPTNERPYLVMVGDPYAVMGAPRYDDPGAPFRDLATAARSEAPPACVSATMTLVADVHTSYGPVGVLRVEDVVRLHRKWPSMMNSTLLADGLANRTSETAIVVVRSLADVPAPVFSNAPVLYAVQTHKDAAMADAAARPNAQERNVRVVMETDDDESRDDDDDDDDDDDARKRRILASQYQLNDFLLFDDTGECMRVTKYGWPRTARRFDAHADTGDIELVEWRRQQQANGVRVPLDSPDLIVEGDTGDVDHRRCCALARANRRHVNVHAPHVHSGRAFSARQMAAVLPPETLNHACVLVLALNDTQRHAGGPRVEGTADDVRAAAALVTTTLYVVAPGGMAEFHAALKRRAWNAWTQMRTLLSPEATAERAMRGAYRPPGEITTIEGGGGDLLQQRKLGAFHRTVNERRTKAVVLEMQAAAITRDQIIDATIHYDASTRQSTLCVERLKTAVAARAQPPPETAAVAAARAHAGDDELRLLPCAREPVRLADVPECDLHTIVRLGSDRMVRILATYAFIKETAASASTATEVLAMRRTLERHLRAYPRRTHVRETALTWQQYETLSVQVSARIVVDDDVLRTMFTDAERTMFRIRVEMAYLGRAELARMLALDEIDGVSESQLIDRVVDTHMTNVNVLLDRARPLPVNDAAIVAIDDDDDERRFVSASLCRIRDQVRDRVRRQEPVP